MRLLAALGAALLLAAPAPAQTPKPGGVISLMQREELAGTRLIGKRLDVQSTWPLSEPVSHT